MREYDSSPHTIKYFNGYFADVEYNRMGNDDLKTYENSKHMPQYMVSDLLIQSRGKEPNLLAVEMKRKGNYKHVKEDKQRLKSLVSSSTDSIQKDCVHDTLLGAYVTFSIDEVKIMFFENINGKGEQTSEVTLAYDSLNSWDTIRI